MGWDGVGEVAARGGHDTTGSHDVERHGDLAVAAGDLDRRRPTWTRASRNRAHRAGGAGADSDLARAGRAVSGSGWVFISYANAAEAAGRGSSSARRRDGRSLERKVALPDVRRERARPISRHGARAKHGVKTGNRAIRGQPASVGALDRFLCCAVRGRRSYDGDRESLCRTLNGKPAFHRCRTKWSRHVWVSLDVLFDPAIRGTPGAERGTHPGVAQRIHLMSIVIWGLTERILRTLKG